MENSREMVLHVAELSKLEIEDKQVDMFADQFEEIIDMENRLKAVNTDGIEPTTHISDRKTVLREDVPNKEQTRDELMANVPESQDGLIKVPAILDSEEEN